MRRRLQKIVEVYTIIGIFMEDAMVAALDISGQKFGRLKVLEFAGAINGRRAYRCLCECGNETIVRTESLRAGITQSCGCIRNERIGDLRKTHALSKTPEYKAWCKIKSRIFNKNDPKYPQYGGRGLEMHQPWVDSFEQFLADMGKRPASKTSIGRIDVERGYFPDNCRWEDVYEQARARTDNVFVELNGVKMVLKDACKKLGLNYKSVHAKIKYKGFSFEEIANAS